jgi:hypothetical protein
MLRRYKPSGIMSVDREAVLKGAVMSTSEIGIRILNEADLLALRRLAERDSAPVPTGTILGASVDGRLTAALSLTSGAEVADPFMPTAELRSLLADRAAQLNGERSGRPRLFGRRLRRRRSRAALPASPPGAGGRLLQI